MESFVYLVLSGMIVVGWIQYRALFDRIKKLDRKVDAILKNLDVDLNAEVDKEVLALASMGKKIEAIKKYREVSGASLKEAKEYVEGL